MNDLNQTPLHIATQMNYLNIINLLLEHKDLDFSKEDYNGMNAFSLACSIGNEEAFDIFIAFKVKQDRSRGNSFHID